MTGGAARPPAATRAATDRPRADPSRRQGGPQSSRSAGSRSRRRSRTRARKCPGHGARIAARRAEDREAGGRPSGPRGCPRGRRFRRHVAVGLGAGRSGARRCRPRRGRRPLSSTPARLPSARSGCHVRMSCNFLPVTVPISRHSGPERVHWLPCA